MPIDEFINLNVNINTQAGEAALGRLDSIADRLQAKLSGMGAGKWKGAGDFKEFEKGEGIVKGFSATLDRHGNIVSSTARAYGQMQDGTRVSISQTDRLSRSTSFLTRELRQVATGLLIWGGISAISSVIEGMIDAQKRLSMEVARFSVVTGTSIGQATEDYRALQDTLARQGIAPSAAGSAPITAARFAPDDQAGQAELLRVSGILSNVLGIAPERSVEVLTAALKQQDLAASEASTVLDQLIAVYRATPSSVEDLAAALTEVTTIQEKLGTSYTDTLGLVAEVGAAADESAETVTNSMIRIVDVIERLEGDKLVEFEETFRSMGISVQDASGQLLDPLDIILAVSEGFGKLGPEMQNKALELLGLLKPTYQQVGRNLLKSLADGQLSGLDVIKDAGEKAGKAFLDSFGGSVQALEASRELVQERGGLLGNIFSGALTAVAPLGGKTAVQSATGINKYISGQTETDVRSAKEDFLKSISGLSPDEAKQAISDYNERVRIAAMQEFKNLPFIANFVPGVAHKIWDAESWLKVNEEEAGKFIAGLELQKKEVQDALKKYFAVLGFDDVDLGGAAKESVSGRKTRGGSRPRPQGSAFAPDMESQEVPLQDRLRNRIIANDDFLPSEPIDLSKLSMEEFNQVLIESEQLFNAILQAQIEQMKLAGLTAEQIDEQVKKIREAAEETLVLVELEGKRFEIVSGIAGVNLSDTASRKQKEEKEAGSDFSFKRLRDVDPSQFGQLQALTQMYDQFLTNIGSPEEKKNINLLMGEENVFKSMNARMSALQLALEDLTKVEKAQLSGVWNLPSGATAWVPLQSMDLMQQGGGGGMSPEAIMALLAQFADAATAGTGGGGYGGGQDPEVAKRRSRLRSTQRGAFDESVSHEQEVASDREMRREQLERRRQQQGLRTPTARPTESSPTAVGRTAMPKLETVVNVAIEPIRATLAINIPVMLNGQVIARIIQSIFTQMMARAARSTSNTGRTVKELK